MRNKIKTEIKEINKDYKNDKMLMFISKKLQDVRNSKILNKGLKGVDIFEDLDGEKGIYEIIFTYKTIGRYFLIFDINFKESDKEFCQFSRYIHGKWQNPERYIGSWDHIKNIINNRWK